MQTQPEVCSWHCAAQELASRPKTLRPAKRPCGLPKDLAACEKTLRPAKRPCGLRKDLAACENDLAACQKSLAPCSNDLAAGLQVPFWPARKPFGDPASWFGSAASRYRPAGRSFARAARWFCSGARRCGQPSRGHTGDNGWCPRPVARCSCNISASHFMGQAGVKDHDEKDNGKSTARS